MAEENFSLPAFISHFREEFDYHIEIQRIMEAKSKLNKQVFANEVYDIFKKDTEVTQFDIVFINKTSGFYVDINNALPPLSDNIAYFGTTNNYLMDNDLKDIRYWLTHLHLPHQVDKSDTQQFDSFTVDKSTVYNLLKEAYQENYSSYMKEILEVELPDNAQNIMKKMKI